MNRNRLIIAYILWTFLGAFGVHRLYLGHIFSGLTLLGCLFLATNVWWAFWLVVVPWYLLDFLLIPRMARPRRVSSQPYQLA